MMFTLKGEQQIHKYMSHYNTYIETQSAVIIVSDIFFSTPHLQFTESDVEIDTPIPHHTTRLAHTSSGKLCYSDYGPPGLSLCVESCLCVTAYIFLFK